MIIRTSESSHLETLDINTENGGEESHVEEMIDDQNDSRESHDLSNDLHNTREQWLGQNEATRLTWTSTKASKVKAKDSSRSRVKVVERPTAESPRATRSGTGSRMSVRETAFVLRKLISARLEQARAVSGLTEPAYCRLRRPARGKS